MPAIFLHPHEWKERVVIWLDKNGKAGLFEDDGSPKDEIKELIASGITVIGVDLLYQGEFLADSKPLEKTGRVANPREAAAYTFGYNHTVFAKRVHDVLTVVSFAKHHELNPKRIDLVGLAGAGHIAAAAAAQSDGQLHAAAIDTQGFRFGDVLDIHSPDFLPGGAKYGDLPVMIELAELKNQWLADEAGANATVQLRENGATKKSLVDAAGSASAVSWLLSL